MLRSLLMGVVAGHRAMTPLAALAGAARRGRLPCDDRTGRLLAIPLVTAGCVMLAAGEMIGDKTGSGSDRTAPIGLVGRIVSGGFAGATLASPGRRGRGATAGIGAAVVAAYAGLAARKWAIGRWGQTASGFVEDGLVLSAAIAIANAGSAPDSASASRRLRRSGAPLQTTGVLT